MENEKIVESKPNLISLEECAKILQKPNSEDIAPEKYKVLYNLRTHASSEAIKILMENYKHLGSSELLRHEVMYILGQISLEDSLEFLVGKMNDGGELPVVRHEAAEALSNFYSKKDYIIEEMSKHLESEVELLKSTVQVGIEKLKMGKESQELYGRQYHGTIEPAAPYSKGDILEKYEIEDN